MYPPIGISPDVVVLEKMLRYRWDWDIRDRDLGDPRDHKNEVTQARVKSRNRGQEKGVDVWLALDALTMCARADLDRVVVASADTDLDMVPAHVRMLPGRGDTEVVQAKILSDGQNLRRNNAYDDTVAIDRKVFEYSRDDFDYSEPLSDEDVASFVRRIGADTDGMHD